MDVQQFLSAKEFAERAGVSTQAVYMAMNGRLKEYVKEVDGKKVIAYQALNKFYQGQESPVCKPSTPPDGQSLQSDLPSLTNTYQALIDSLKEQIEGLKSEVSFLRSEVVAKQKTIDDLTERLHENNVILSQKLPAALPDKKEAPEDVDVLGNVVPGAAVPDPVPPESETKVQQSDDGQPEQNRGGFFGLFGRGRKKK